MAIVPAETAVVVLETETLRLEWDHETGLFALRSDAVGLALRYLEIAAVFRDGGRRIPWHSSDVAVVRETIAFERGRSLQVQLTSLATDVTASVAFVVRDDWILVQVVAESPTFTLERLTPVHCRTPLDRAFEPTLPVADLSCFKHGWQSWSPSRTFRADERDESASWLPFVHRMTAYPPRAGRGKAGHFTSECVTAVGEAATSRGLVAGCLDVQRGFPGFEVRFGDLAVEEASLAGVGAERADWSQPGVHESETFVLGLFADVAKGLRSWAETTARHCKVTPPRRAPLGWCSWYRFFADVTEDDIRRNLDRLPQLQACVRGETPLDGPQVFFQIDDGFQRSLGDWLDTAESFPTGLADLSTAIKEHDALPGLWLAPFLVSSRSGIARDHPDWLLRGRLRIPVRGGVNPRWQILPVPTLDITHPEVLEHLRGLFTTLTKEHGFRYLKLDFLYAGALPGRRHDPSITAAEALRRAFEMIREAVGPDVFLEGCGCPLGTGLGIFDVMRTACDVHTEWHPREAELIGDDGVYSTKNALRNGLYRGFLQGAWWQNHVDCLLLRDAHLELTPAERLSLVTIVAMNGGAIVDSDDLAEIAPDWWEHLRRIVPTTGEAALPLDILRGEWPEQLVLDVKRDWGSWKVVAQFNWTAEPREVHLDLERLGFGGSRVHVTDFWEGADLGVFTTTAAAAPTGPVATLPAHGCRLLRLTAENGLPQPIGYLNHYAQGATFLKSSLWDSRSRIWTLTVKGYPRMEHDLLLRMPDATGQMQVSSSFGNYELEHVREGVVRFRTTGEGLGTIRFTFA